MNTSNKLIIASLVFLGSWTIGVLGQVECAAPGNLRGIRVDGELMAFSTGIRMAVPTTAQDGQGGRGGGGGGGGQFSRDGGALIVSGNLSGGAGRGGGAFGGGRGRGGAPAPGVSFRATYKDVSPGTVSAEVQITATTNTPMQGIFFSVTLPGADYAGSSAYFITPTTTEVRGAGSYSRATASGVRVESPRRQIALTLPAPAEFVLQTVTNRGNSDLVVSFPLSMGDLTNGHIVRANFTIKATGEVDKSPAKLAIEPSKPGRKYDGMGGNFRIQSTADAAQIQYNLDNLRIAWGRVAMPLDRWQPNEDANPAETATTNTLNSNVVEAMQMAGKLARKNIPTVISIWSAPNWALETSGAARGGRARINPEKWDKVCKSISSYIEFMKKHYDAEPVLFSFNESDMGINVLQSPQEHADTIKRLGAYFASRGLKTRMLLGDTGNPKGDKFIDVAVADPEAAKYIGAVSFHSWNGGTTEQYTHFSDAARKLNVPLLVGEGGLDPAAHQYRAIFLEPWFCINEIAQYVEICHVAQPLSILHWQLTYDYSILTGGTGGRPLEPAQRFWQIKQLGMTAADSASVPITCNNPKVISCAFTDHGSYVAHLVNNGAARTATISGLPSSIKEVKVLVTDNTRGMRETGRLPVSQGVVQLSLDPMSLTSLAGKP